MATLIFTPVTLELGAPAVVADLWQVSAGQGALTCKLVGLLDGDVVQQMAFTAKSPSNRGALVQKLINATARADGQITAVPLNALQAKAAFSFEAGDIDALRTTDDYTYSVRAWVLRAGATFWRDLLVGRITAAPNPTAVTGVVLGDVTEVDVAPATATLFTQQSYPFVATTRTAGGTIVTGRVVVWSTSNAAVATVDSTGIVTPVAPGSVTITATSEGVAGTAAVVVTALTIGGGFTIGG